MAVPVEFGSRNTLTEITDSVGNRKVPNLCSAALKETTKRERERPQFLEQS